MTSPLYPLQQQTRRHFLSQVGQFSLGAIALRALSPKTFAGDAIDASQPLLSRPPHYAPKAKRVIYLHMSGGPPHLDLFDYKPELVKRDGQFAPDAFVKGKKFAFTSGTPRLMGTPRTFAQYGSGGLWMSDAIPHFQSIADELCVIRSMTTDQFNHTPAELLLFTGSPRQGRPSMGSWVTYGLGTANENLPGFVVLVSSGTQPSAGQAVWGTGFIPSVFQGVQCRSKGDPVLYVSDPPGIDRTMRRHTLDALRELNELQAGELGHPETTTRISQYELAFRMQASVPEVMDISREPTSVLEAYGAQPGQASFANNCLLGRRLPRDDDRRVLGPQHAAAGVAMGAGEFGHPRRAEVGGQVAGERGLPGGLGAEDADAAGHGQASRPAGAPGSSRQSYQPFTARPVSRA